eukprot:Platyproteum_vivax@DN6664_c0_g1_i2.p1
MQDEIEEKTVLTTQYSEAYNSCATYSEDEYEDDDPLDNPACAWVCFVIGFFTLLGWVIGALIWSQMKTAEFPKKRKVFSYSATALLIFSLVVLVAGLCVMGYYGLKD